MALALVPSNELAERYVKWENTQRKTPALRWRMPWVERALGVGPSPGTTVVVGARTNVGKGYFTIHMLRAFAESGPVVYLSLEDASLECGRRLATAAYAHPNLYVGLPEPGGLLATFEEVCASSLKPLVVAVDYIQCAGFDAETLTGVMNGLRDRTRAANVVSVIASQVNRPPGGEDAGGIPPTWRLKGAGAIEERADIIFMLGASKDHTLLAEIAKAKGAPTGDRARYHRGEGGRLQPVTEELEG